MKKKQYLALFLAAAMTVSLSACAGEQPQNTPETEAVSDTSQADSEAAESEAEEESGAAESTEKALPAVGEKIAGFTLKELSTCSDLAADTLYFEHDQSGAGLFYVKNDDTNRTFAITYRTPMVNEADINHVFEHAVLASSEKYPSKDLFFDLMGKTYSTFVNAMTYSTFTSYPLSSQSEEQLIKMADAYLSCMVAPDLLEDERFFKREAIRYELYDKEDPITMTGTVFSEDMGGLTDVYSESYRNTMQALYPGEYGANIVGRAHVNYEDLTYESVTAAHERCYNFDNSLIFLYGDLNYEAFMEFLDQEYLSKAERGKTDLSMYMDGPTEPGHVTAEAFSPAYEGDSVENAGQIEYVFSLDGTETEKQLQYLIFSNIVGSDGSVMSENLKAAGISNTFRASVNIDVFKPVWNMTLYNANADQTEVFRDTVLETLMEISVDGVDPEFYNTILKALDLSRQLTGEDSAAFINSVLPSVSALWSVSGETDYFGRLDAVLETFENDTDQVLIKQLAAELMIIPRTALVTTIPQPGLAEEIEAQQRAYLDEMKASMSEAELEQLIADTQEFNEWNASEGSNDSFMIPIEDLPAPEEQPEFTKTETDGITVYAAGTGQKSAYNSRLYLDTSAVAQEDLHYIGLYTLLLGELSTEQYAKEELPGEMMEKLYDLTVDPVYPSKAAKENSRPMLQISWYGLSESYEESLQFLLEVMEHTDFQDRETMMQTLDRILPAADPARADPFNQAIELASTGTDQQNFYYSYMSGSEFYTFLTTVREKLETEEDYIDELAAKLKEIQKQVLHKDKAIVMMAAPEGETERMSEAVVQALNTLPAQDAEPQTYEFELYPRRMGVIAEASNYYTVAFADLRNETYSGTIFPFVAALNDKYIVPRLRFQNGAYSGSVSAGSALNHLLFFGYSDPNVKETIEIINQSAAVLEEMELTREELDGYILSAYRTATEPQGMLARYMLAMEKDMKGFDQQHFRELIADIPKTTLEDQKETAEFLSRITDAFRIVTVGKEEKLKSEADCFDLVVDYR